MKLSITVKPNSRKGPAVIQTGPTTYTVYLRAKPKDGEANATLIATLADYFQVPKTTIAITRGHTSRHKIISLPD